MHILSAQKIYLCYAYYWTIQFIFEIKIAIYIPSYLSFPISPFDILIFFASSW